MMNHSMSNLANRKGRGWDWGSVEQHVS